MLICPQQNPQESKYTLQFMAGVAYKHLIMQAFGDASIWSRKHCISSSSAYVKAKMSMLTPYSSVSVLHMLLYHHNNTCFVVVNKTIGNEHTILV